MGYVCMKPLKVQVAPGKVVMRKPGEAVPEAESWANPAVWIRRGFIAPDDELTASISGYSRAKLLPARPATPEDSARAVSQVPKPGKPLPGLPAANDDGLEDGAKAELLKMTRAEMDEFAKENTGIEDPSSYPNKEALADAILEAAGE